MPNVLDAFRAQREAADAVHARCAEGWRKSQAFPGVCRAEAEALARDDELRTLLRQEETWLAQPQRTVADVRHWRELELHRFWPGVVHRWALALAFALAGAWAVGAGYARVTKPYAAEMVELRLRSNFGALVARRVMIMTDSERRQFDALMGWKAPAKR